MNLAPITRLSALARLLPSDIAILESALDQRRTVARDRRVCGDAAEAEPIALLNGWAARVRSTADGKRQLIGLSLPGDVVQMTNDRYPVVALTDVVVARLPAISTHSALHAALDLSGQLDAAYLYDQVARIGGMTAADRLMDLLREIFERLLLSGVTDAQTFAMPVTQVVLGDLLAITSVHTNRMIKAARSSGELSWEKGRVTIRKGGALDKEARRNFTSTIKAVGAARRS